MTARPVRERAMASAVKEQWLAVFLRVHVEDLADEQAVVAAGMNVRHARRDRRDAFACGLAGALYFLGNLRISPDAAFSVNGTAFSIFIVMVGGIASIEGPIIGVIVFYLLNRLFSDYGTWYLVGLGLLAIVVATRFPKGLRGTVSRRFGLHFFPVHRRLSFDKPTPEARP